MIDGGFMRKPIGPLAAGATPSGAAPRLVVAEEDVAAEERVESGSAARSAPLHVEAASTAVAPAEQAGSHESLLSEERASLRPVALRRGPAGGGAGASTSGAQGWTATANGGAAKRAAEAARRYYSQFRRERPKAAAAATVAVAGASAALIVVLWRRSSSGEGGGGRGRSDATVATVRFLQKGGGR